MTPKHLQSKHDRFLQNIEEEIKDAEKIDDPLKRIEAIDKILDKLGKQMDEEY